MLMLAEPAALLLKGGVKDTRAAWSLGYLTKTENSQQGWAILCPSSACRHRTCSAPIKDRSLSFLALSRFALQSCLPYDAVCHPFEAPGTAAASHDSQPSSYSSNNSNEPSPRHRLSEPRIRYTTRV